jgi:hypothetical protein
LILSQIEGISNQPGLRLTRLKITALEKVIKTELTLKMWSFRPKEEDGGWEYEKKGVKRGRKNRA